MNIFSGDYLKNLGTDIFCACGAPRDEARIVANELVEANLMGLDSHGVVRYIWYVEEVLNGHIKPGAPVEILKETPTTAVVDCGFNFGPVGANRMVDIACQKAKKCHVSCVVSWRNHHVGRLGAYVQKIAEYGMFAFATATSPKSGHYVSPWGGKEGRLATNPLAYAVPTSGYPVVLDMSTSMISEGQIRILMHEDKPIPAGCVLDADGNPTTDPKAFYGPPRGTILSLGGTMGYKGFGLSLLVEILGSTLVGETISEEYNYMNGLCLIVIDPGAFCGIDRFTELMDQVCEYTTTVSTAPGFDEVVMPGALDFRTREVRKVHGIPLDDHTWELITNAAQKVGVGVKEQCR